MRKEIIGILLLFLILLTSGSIFSFSPADPSINNHVFSHARSVENLFGLVGAQLAGMLVGLFGLGSFWVPVLLFLCSVWYLKGRSSRIMVLTFLGGLLLVISSGSMLALFQDQYVLWGRSYPAGGFVGMPLTYFLLKYANPAGCVTVLVLFFILGIILSTGISMITLFLMMKRFFLKYCSFIAGTMDKCGTFFAKWVDAWKKKRKSRRKEIKIKRVADREKKQILLEEKRKAAKETLSKTKKKEPVVTTVDYRETASVAEERFNDIREDAGFVLPPVSLLNEGRKIKHSISIETLKVKGVILERKLNDFGISGEVVEILPGPVITTFEYRPAPGIKISKIVNLTDDLALALSAISIRIIAPIPGKDVIGVEIPNDKRENVSLKSLISSKAFIESASKLTLGLGKDILGTPFATKMDSMPHLLIAGATGTGKSVCLNSLIISLLYKATPDEVKFIMVDPKRIELSVYDGIPHLISPVVTDMKKATNALFWAVREMERRYELLAQSGVRNILQYNTMLDKTIDPGNREPVSDEEGITEKLPYIVVIVDEFADLMMVGSRDVETALIRLAQMARAAGIHLILATQRPSVNVLTGIIKANFPTRISFQVSSRIDSRTILDTNGSERLLGNGDMLFLPPGTGRLQRIQGAYISEAEIARVTGFLKSQKPPEYVDDVTRQVDEEKTRLDKEDYDEKYDEAVALVTRTRQASISSVQRHLRVGYNRAARIIEVMEVEGIIGPADGSKPRAVLVKDYDSMG